MSLSAISRRPANAKRAADMLALLSTRWLDARAISERLQCDRVTATMWCAEWVDAGVLCDRFAAPGSPGARAVEFALAKRYGGIA